MLKWSAVPRLPRIRWAALVPTRWSWARLFTTPSSYALVVALVVTVAAKAHVLRRIDDIGFWPGQVIAAAAPDGVVFLGIAAALAVIEHASRRALALTLPIAIAVATLAVVSAIELWLTGEQLTAHVVTLALERFQDVRSMARATLDLGAAGWLLALAALALPPVVAGRALRRSGRPLFPTADGSDRARAAGAFAALALLLVIVAPVPEHLAGLYRNGVARTISGLVSGERDVTGASGQFSGYKPHALVEPAALDRLRAGARPNIVIIVLESTRRDATTLAGPAASAKTPTLEQLAARGLEVTHGRAVITHTTKSLWSMFCGRLPILQPKVYETTSASEAQCVPHILSVAGWRTGFLQSAIGRFEDRPRLVLRLGFRDFIAAEQYTTEIGGYLASDDELLVGQLDAWLAKSNTSSPFMVTILTSGTHHPYVLSKALAARVMAKGLPSTSARERYDRLVEAQDAMIAGMLELLRRRGVLDNTIVVVLGDHGEGFGDKAALQHAANYYEEGLRVPWVMAGPGVPTKRIDANASVLDLAPTLLDLLGVELSPDATAATHARSVLRIGHDRVLPFSCFFQQACFGFVVDQTKVIAIGDTGSVFAFDLASDPHERSAIPLTRDLTAILERVRATVNLHRTNNAPVWRDPMFDFWPWNCPLDQPCGIKN